MEINSHPALIFEFWKKINFESKYKLQFNNRVLYVGLEIDASRFYFYLKEKHGSPNVGYESIAHFFPERQISTGRDWCFVFEHKSNYILISGDDKINLTVLSLGPSPTKMDFDIFSSNINRLLEDFPLRKYEHKSYNLFLNYSFYLEKIISESKKVFGGVECKSPELLSMDLNDIDTQNPEIKYKYIENRLDYNHWLRSVLSKSTLSLQIQIIYPIYFESLIDLAFRVKLQGCYHNLDKIYGEKEPKNNVFQYFEKLNIKEKLNELKRMCIEVNERKADLFIDSISKDKLRGNRNKLLHGNALFFKNMNVKYYVDDGCLIGYPDRAKGKKVIANSIEGSVNNKDILEFIENYENRCNSFIDIFDDNGYFKSLISCIAFGYNTRVGGVFSLGLEKYEDLFAPDDFEQD